MMQICLHVLERTFLFVVFLFAVWMVYKGLSDDIDR